MSIPKKTIALATLALLTAVNVAQAAPASPMTTPHAISKTAFLNASRPGLAPFAFVRFCINNAGDCKASTGDAKITLTNTERATLRQINSAVNRNIKPTSDSVGADLWQADVSNGDCEDYVLTKRRKLLAAGFAPSALRIALARTGSGEGHAVLVVRTDRGDLVLDNRFDDIRRWNATDLRVLKIQSGSNPRIWYDL